MHCRGWKSEELWNPGIHLGTVQNKSMVFHCLYVTKKWCSEFSTIGQRHWQWLLRGVKLLVDLLFLPRFSQTIIVYMVVSTVWTFRLYLILQAPPAVLLCILFFWLFVGLNYIVVNRVYKRFIKGIKSFPWCFAECHGRPFIATFYKLCSKLKGNTTEIVTLWLSIQLFLRIPHKKRFY